MILNLLQILFAIILCCITVLVLVATVLIVAEVLSIVMNGDDGGHFLR